MEISQPEGEGDETTRFVVRDDKQVELDPRDIDKSVELHGVPPELDGVVDRAVELARTYRRLPDVLRKMSDDIERYLQYKTTSHMHTFADIPAEQWSALGELAVQTTNFFTRTMNDVEARDNAIWDILGGFSMNLMNVKPGCLIFEVALASQQELALILNYLEPVLRKLRAVIMDQNSFQSKLQRYLDVKTEFSSEEKQMLPHFISQLRDKVKVEISIPRYHMLQALESLPETETTGEEGGPVVRPVIELTIMVRIHPSSYKPSESATAEAKAMKDKFLTPFEPYKRVHEALRSVFNKADARGAEGGESGGSKASFKPPQTSVYRGPLSPPSASSSSSGGASASGAYATPFSGTNIHVKGLPGHATDKFLFEKFRSYGAILHVTTVKDQISLRCKGFGYVHFIDEIGAENACTSPPEGLTVDKARERAMDLSKVTLVFLELGADTTEQELASVCSQYGPIAWSSFRFDRYTRLNKYLVKYGTPDHARAALTAMQPQGTFVIMAKGPDRGRM